MLTTMHNGDEEIYYDQMPSAWGTKQPLGSERRKDEDGTAAD